MANKGSENLFSVDEIVAPGEIISKFFQEATSVETAAALLKFSGGKEANYLIFRDEARNVRLVVKEKSGQPVAYIIVDTHECVLLANAEATREELVAYLRFRSKGALSDDPRIELTVFEK